LNKIKVKKGDYGFSQPFVIKKNDGTLFDLTTYTVTLVIWNGSGIKDTIIGSLDANPATGKCSFTIGAVTFNTVGTYNFHIKITKAGTQVSTFTYEVEVESTNP